MAIGDGDQVVICKVAARGDGAGEVGAVPSAKVIGGCLVGCYVVLLLVFGGLHIGEAGMPVGVGALLLRWRVGVAVAMVMEGGFGAVRWNLMPVSESPRNGGALVERVVLVHDLRHWVVPAQEILTEVL